MHRAARFLGQGRPVRARLIVSGVAGQAVGLALLHHLWNLWGLPWDKQAMAVLIVGPGLAVLILAALAPVWDDISEIRTSRWLLFAVPAALIAGGLTWSFFVLPETRHVLTIKPAVNDGASTVQISEIRLAHGNAVPLGEFSGLDGWNLWEGLLVTKSPSAAEINREFYGPAGEQTRISFITTPKGGSVVVTLDGRPLELALSGVEGNETRARLTAGFGWGKLDALFIPLLAGIDWLAFLSLLAAAWIAMELGQRRAMRADLPASNSFRFQAAGLATVCSIAFALHVANFLAVPLRVTKDSPSYLQGAAHWATHGNLDGASSYRGPGTTFLLGPAMMVFGRHPWGVKLVLHFLAFLCVPLAYRIGWQLQRRRWVAIAAGTGAAVSPDLYAYSNYVLSEVPDIFALLLFFSAMLSALQGFAPFWVVFSMLAGSTAVLVRTDNAAALLSGAAVLLLGVWRTHGRDAAGPAQGRSTTRRAKVVALALLAALAPLGAWSAHNARVHGFFGLSDYSGEILYDGWIYFGESAGIKFIDRKSPAVREIDSVVPISARGRAGPPTGWTVYDRLRRAGKTSAEAFSLLGEAATDSILRDPNRTAKVLVMKLRQALRPHPTLPASVASGGLTDRHAGLTGEFFYMEAGLVQSLGRIQDRVSDFTQALYAPITAAWLAYGLLQLWLSSYRQPSQVWVPLTATTLIVLVLPTVVGLVSWRYLLPGLSLLTPLAMASSDTFGQFAAHWLKRLRMAA